jgi:hypothetical protein
MKKDFRHTILRTALRQAPDMTSTWLIHQLSLYDIMVGRLKGLAIAENLFIHKNNGPIGVEVMQT